MAVPVIIKENIQMHCCHILWWIFKESKQKKRHTYTYIDC